MGKCAHCKDKVSTGNELPSSDCQLCTWPKRRVCARCWKNRFAFHTYLNQRERSKSPKRNKSPERDNSPERPKTKQRLEEKKKKFEDHLKKIVDELRQMNEDERTPRWILKGFDTIPSSGGWKFSSVFVRRHEAEQKLSELKNDNWIVSANGECNVRWTKMYIEEIDKQ